MRTFPCYHTHVPLLMIVKNWLIGANNRSISMVLWNRKMIIWCNISSLTKIHLLRPSKPLYKIFDPRPRRLMVHLIVFACLNATGLSSILDQKTNDFCEKIDVKRLSIFRIHETLNQPLHPIITMVKNPSNLHQLILVAILIFTSSCSRNSIAWNSW